jgi:hypothetical protein
MNINDQVKVKYRRKEYYGIIKKKINGLYFVRYEISYNRFTTGYFDEEDVELCEKKEIEKHELRKMENVRIKCKKCKSIFVAEKNADKDYGYCPNCMGKKWTEFKDIGYY